MSHPTPPILIAEDDDNDALFLKRTFEKVGITTPIQIVHDGEEAILYLGAEGKYADRDQYPFPRLVMTDIKMPKRDGFEVLQWVKRHPECHIIPIIVWSSSAMGSDVAKAYQLGANCYFKKPSSPDAWNDAIELIFKFWNAAEKPPMKLARCAEAH